MQKAVFLDRDGTINRDTGYIKNTGEVEILDGVGEALRKLKGKGFLLIIVTNQSGIARGYYDEDALALVNNYIAEKLEKEGARVDDIFYCPHHPDKGSAIYRMDCSCRKPKPGLILQAVEKYGIDASKSFIIGDSLRDVEAGNRAGVRGLLINAEAKTREADAEPAAVKAALEMAKLSAAAAGGGAGSHIIPIYTGKSLLDCTEWLLKFVETKPHEA